MSSASKEELNEFKQFMDIARGKEDVRERLSWLFQPSNPLTSSNLTVGQSEFVADAHLVKEHFKKFAPLKELALYVLASSVSIKGRRVEDAIQYERARSKGEGGTQVGIFTGLKEKLKGKEGKDDK